MCNVKEEGLIREIQEAFKDVKLGNGISLNMTEYHDAGGCMPEFAEKANFDERDEWSRIPDSVLEQFTVTFSFTDLEGFRFYLPAYMIWTIRNHATNNSIIADFTIYALDPHHYLFRDFDFLAFFTQRQLESIMCFLKYCIQQEDFLDAPVAERNLRAIESLRSGEH